MKNNLVTLAVLASLVFNQTQCMDIQQETEQIRKVILIQNSIIDNSLYLRVKDHYHRIKSENSTLAKTFLMNVYNNLQTRELRANQFNLPSPYESPQVRNNITAFLINSMHKRTKSNVIPPQ